ncbi:Rho termination factor N-terminal domain-containing protein [Jeotgalibacillus campisalis]|uniref:Rho termination factor-like N-terminal domain-containing protein n=1 Tax=Jeotgalibacillus campisalis TaxID=220754 RepID=A0A0C2VB55_9BACL|nr:Rho termination factor N-terminal domain-containing protein [Jeotgalibacillus campisalis]KIL46162.1 hypothetical protein KR50_28370 [Jeotgalibacillus campisalis]
MDKKRRGTLEPPSTILKAGENMGATSFQRMRREQAKTKNTEMKTNTQHVEIIKGKTKTGDVNADLNEAERIEQERMAAEREEVEKRQLALEYELNSTPEEEVTENDSLDEPKAYKDMTVPELKEVAKEKEIKGYSSMKQKELIQALEG